MTFANDKIGPGILVLIVGPSGAGKDTLINLVRAECSGDPAIVFPRRVVTRAASGHEDHDSLSEEAFEARTKAGGFALAWDAHGLRYGVPSEIDADIRQSKTVVCNVSRAIVGGARARYAQCLVVLVTAPEEILRQRLNSRGRTSDGSVSERMARGTPADLIPDLVIDNVGDPQESAASLLAFIKRRSI